MDFITQLWLPIVLSAAFVWFWNFLSWAVLDLHAKDYSGVPSEHSFLAALRPLNLPPGNYSFPHAETRAQRSGQAFLDNCKGGPIGILKVWPTTINMATPMIASFVLCLVVAFLLAYLASVTLKPGDPFGRIMQVIGTAGVLAHCVGFWPGGIWFRAKLRALVITTFDGLVAGFGTAAIFAAFWPKV